MFMKTICGQPAKDHAVIYRRTGNRPNAPLDPTEPYCLGGEPQLPNIFQNPPKNGLRREAHSSICIQEGEPAHTSSSPLDFLKATSAVGRSAVRLDQRSRSAHEERRRWPTTTFIVSRTRSSSTCSASERRSRSS